MLLNSFSSHYTPNNNNKSIVNTNTNSQPSNSDNMNNNINNNYRQNSNRNGLSRLFNQCCCPNDTEEDPCCPNRGISLSTILFFVLIFLILFYSD